ncbi:MAG: thermonuclease family protein [Desulfuromonadaceae bacterium]|nr:thermonuclease family protein [Desulfuromonadaceae bacterium]MDD2847307.1 thermonuclease family protein [Desulfuromonadaceae bacterium]MDD4130251.1 thermonuclease family protein [Desulfuromonadaceae bacterium]
MRTCLALLLQLLFLASSAHAGRTIEGMVRAVYDGDTVLLTTREESRLKVRLYGIDAPETQKPDKPGQAYGAIARRTLMYKVMGRRVTAELVDIDKHKRAVAIIRYSGRDINREMVSEGMAWAYRQYLQGAYASEYIGAENLARSRRVGIWRESNPQPPWEFRNGRKGRRKH